MKTLHFLLATLLACSCANQPAPQGNAPANIPTDTAVAHKKDSKGLVIKDFNGDGISDTLTNQYSGGSMFGGPTIRLTDGKTKEQYELDVVSSFGTFRTPVYVPLPLAAEKNAAFLSALLERLPELRPKPDPSLNWINYGLYHHSDLKRHPYFKRVIRFPNDWLEGEMALPQTYTIAVDPDSLLLLPPAWDDVGDWKKEPGAKYFLIYSGHNHYNNCLSGDTTFSVTRESAGYKIWRTCHGLVAQKNNRYKWVFVSEAGLTGAPNKLRFGSIGYTAMTGSCLFVLHLPTEAYDWGSRLWVIEMERGVCAEMKDRIKSFDLQGDTLTLETETGNRAFRVKQILNALNKVRRK